MTEYCTERVMVNDVPTPRQPLAEVAKETNSVLTEVILMMQDAEITLFGGPTGDPMNKQEEARCFEDELNMVLRKSRMALERFAEIEDNKLKQKATSENTQCLKPIIDYWVRGESGVRGKRGPMAEALPKYKGYATYEHVRRIVCNIMDESYVRDIKDVERARHIANSLCELITKLAKEEQA